MNTMLAERVQQWYAEAERRGELRGKATSLWQLLETRWGAVPETFKQQLLALTSELLSQCLTRVWTAHSLEEVWPGATQH